MGASGNSRCKRPRKAGRAAWAPAEVAEARGRLAGAGEALSLFQEQREATGVSGCLLLCFVFCFLFFGGWCDQLHSVKCESYFGGKIDKTRW